MRGGATYVWQKFKRKDVGFGFFLPLLDGEVHLKFELEIPLYYGLEVQVFKANRMNGNGKRK